MHTEARYEVCLDKNALRVQAGIAADLLAVCFDELLRIVDRVESVDQAVALHSFACASSKFTVAGQLREAVDVTGVGEEEADNGSELET